MDIEKLLLLDNGVSGTLIPDDEVVSQRLLRLFEILCQYPHVYARILGLVYFKDRRATNVFCQPFPYGTGLQRAEGRLNRR